MATTEDVGPEPIPGVISVSTTDFDSATPAERVIPTKSDPGANVVGSGATPNHGAVDSNTGETQVWQGRYAFGNFAARFLLGFILIGVSLYFTYKASEPDNRGFRPLAILAGVAAGGYWLWLTFNLFRSRFSHHYRLTSKRLFVSSGIFRRQDDMMELEDLKEVTVNQQKMFDHVCNVGHVIVTSNVKDSPTLILVGVQNPRQISDLVYRHARGDAPK